MPNPIHKVLSVLRYHKVKHLLMGGQACILYGAAEFSRDTDVALLADPVNLNKLSRAVAELGATVVAVPPCHIDYLKRGHAVHFRCHNPEVDGMRLDVMSVMRGLPGFMTLWRRRTIVRINKDKTFDLLSLPDLVTAKKTQRDKDWPMIRRLLESHYIEFSNKPNIKQIKFWLNELRTPALLRVVARAFPEHVQCVSARRPWIKQISAMSDAAIEHALFEEERQEREADRNYWQPLRKELEQIRLSVHRTGKRSRLPRGG